MKRQDFLSTFKNSEDQRTIRSLTRLIWAELGLFIIVAIITLVWKDWRTLSVIGAATVLQIAPLWLFKHRHFQAGGMLFVVINITITAIIAAFGQGIYDVAIVAFPIIFVFAGLVLNRILFRICVGLGLVAVCSLVIGENKGWIITQPLPADYLHLFYLTGVVALLLLAGFAVDLLATNLRNSLKQSKQEIERREQTEEALRLSEEKYRLIVEKSQDVLFTFNEKGEFLYLSPSIKNLLGYDQKDLIGRPFASLILPEDLPGLQQIIQRNIKDGSQTPGGNRYRVRKASGEWRWHNVSGNAVHDANGKFLYFLAISRDITERKKDEELLIESEKRFRTLIEKAPVAINVSRNGIVLYANQKLMRLMRYQNPEEHIGHLVTEIFAPQFREESEERPWRSPGLPDPENFESILTRSDGTQFPVSVLVSQVELSDGMANIAFITDIAQWKKAEADLLEAQAQQKKIEEKAQISSRLASVGEMAAGIAHEINNPLTSVLGFSQMLLEKETIPKDVKEELKLIADGSQRVADIVKRLLTFARQTKPMKTSVNLNELIDNTLKLRSYVLKTANINVVTRFDPELPHLEVDPGQIQQVFVNLIVNAEQSMKKAHGKGTLTITTEKIENKIVLSFQDDGLGITKEIRARLFEPFFTTKEIGEGTGLGLSLSRSIILDHDGDINVESEPGHGANFVIELPLIFASAAEKNSATPLSDTQLSEQKNGKILVVDDETCVRVLLEKVLTQMGYSVDTIGNPGIVSDKLDSNVIYDAILLDIRMPGMSGTELYFRILEKAPALKNKIIIVTGDVMGLDVKTFLAQNNLPFLSKPFDITLLKKHISDIVNVR